MIQHLTPTEADRLDDYRIEEILERRTLGPLRKVPFDAPAGDKASALQLAVQGFYGTIKLFGLDKS